MAVKATTNAWLETVISNAFMDAEEYPAFMVSDRAGIYAEWFDSRCKTHGKIDFDRSKIQRKRLVDNLIVDYSIAACFLDTAGSIYDGEVLRCAQDNGFGTHRRLTLLTQCRAFFSVNPSPSNTCPKCPLHDAQMISTLRPSASGTRLTAPGIS